MKVQCPVKEAPGLGAYSFICEIFRSGRAGSPAPASLNGLVKETTLMASALCNKAYQREMILHALVLHLKHQA